MIEEVEYDTAMDGKNYDIFINGLPCGSRVGSESSAEIITEWLKINKEFINDHFTNPIKVNMDGLPF